MVNVSVWRSLANAQQMGHAHRADRRRGSLPARSSGLGEEYAMPQNAIFGPVFATISLTLVVWVYMYARRIHFITQSALSPQDLAAPGRLAELAPAAVANPSDNLKNLFEMPVRGCPRRC